MQTNSMDNKKNKFTLTDNEPLGTIRGSIGSSFDILQRYDSDKSDRKNRTQTSVPDVSRRFSQIEMHND